MTFSLAPLSAPTGNTPKGPIAVSTGYDVPTFKWDPVTGADNYYIAIVDLTSGGSVVLSNNKVSGLSWTATAPLTPGHSYYWYVGAENSNGGGIAWSSPVKFTLASL